MATTSSKSSTSEQASADHKATKVGVVESDKRSKTRTVVVSFMSKHPKYGKYIASRTTLQVHDEKNLSRRGDVVEIVECRPISKSKTWTLARIVEQRSVRFVEPVTVSTDLVAGKKEEASA
ncbi:MAG: 30S ribosomal protein S17 [Planctomycetota bacterium]|nr:30S ribosomal protein S17 [Planctomycetota bacterium]